MEQYKQEFIEFMVDCGVLKFGDFVTKSGRKTPFFINAGLYCTGMQLRKLGEFYAKAIHHTFGTEVKYCANRKEIKDHGDTGILLGSPIKDGDRVIIIEDVTTAGTSIQETLPIIKGQGNVNVLGLVVSVDRMERGHGEKSALSEIRENYEMQTTAIVTMEEVIEHLYNKPYKGKIIIDDTMKASIDGYYEKYGAK